MRKIRKPEYKKNHPYIGKRNAWSLYSYLSPNLCAGLRRFLTLELAPVPADFKTEEEWKDAIRQMLRSFEEVHMDYPDDPRSNWLTKECQKLEAAGLPVITTKKDPDCPGLWQLTYNTPEEPEELIDEMLAYNSEIQKGIRLFAKYYRELHTDITPPPMVHRKQGEMPVRKRQLARLRKEPLVSETDAANLAALFTPFLCAGLRRFYTMNRFGYMDEAGEPEEWNEIIGKMLYSFEQIRRDYCSSPTEDQPPVVNSSEEEKKVLEGLDLFGKYYRNLWD